MEIINSLEDLQYFFWNEVMSNNECVQIWLLNKSYSSVHILQASIGGDGGPHNLED